MKARITTNSLRIYMIFAIAATLLLGCSKPNDPIIEPLVKSVVVIKTATNVTKTSATISAVVIPNEETTISFEFSSLDNDWTTRSLNLSYNGKDSVLVSLNLDNLTPNEKYQFRVKANGKAGEVVSDMGYFQVYSVNDYDGNLYHTVTIGEQTWLKENLRTTHYANGDPIPNIPDLNAFQYSTTTGAYNWYNNDLELGKVYGALYNWYVGNDPRGLILGWDTPTADDWRELKRFIDPGIEGYAPGVLLLEAGYAHWINTNMERKDPYGFTALPNGAIVIPNGFTAFHYCYLGESASFLSKTEMSGLGNFIDISAPTCVLNYAGFNHKSEANGLRLIKIQ